MGDSLSTQVGLIPIPRSDSSRPDQNPHLLIVHLGANPSLSLKSPRAQQGQQVEKHSLLPSCVVSGSHSVCSLSFLVSDVGGALPQTCSGPWAPGRRGMAVVVRTLLGRKCKKGFMDVQAYSVGVALYLIIHFHEHQNHSGSCLNNICGIHL